MARPTKLTPAVQALLLEAVRKGAPLTTCCDFAGITLQTLQNWLTRALELEAGDETPAAGDPDYLGFLTAWRHAQAEVQIGAITALRDHFPNTFRAPLEFLARRNPAEWATQDRRTVTHQVQIGPAVQVLQIGDLSALRGLLAPPAPAPLLVEGEVIGP